jgi:D-arginine dehydrogenase
MDSCDVLIIGAGIAGASIAYELAPYASVVLLEREREPGRHATGHAAATFAPGHGNPVVRALTRASRRSFEARIDGLADQPVLTSRGALIIAREDQHARLDACQAAAAASGHPLERLDAGAALALAPALRPEYVAGALYDPDLCDLDGAAIHRGYLDGLHARGGRLVTDAEVLRVGGEGAPWRVETRAGPFESAVLVDAAGAWADELAQLAGVIPVGLTFTRRHGFLLQPTLEPEPDWPLVRDVDEAFRFRPDAGLLLGAPADSPASAPGAAQPDERQVAGAITRIEQASRLRMHRLIRSWAGLCTFTADRSPVVGMEETVPGFFWLAGQGDAGIQIAPALAHAAARLLVDGVLPDDLLALGLTAEDLMPARLRPLAYRPVNVGGV